MKMSSYIKKHIFEDLDNKDQGQDYYPPLHKKHLSSNVLEELDGMPKKRPDLLVYIDVSLEKMQWQ